MSSHSLSSLLSSTDDVNNSTNLTAEVVASNDTASIATTTLVSSLATNSKVLVTKISTATSTLPPLSTVAPVEDDSHIIFGFCTILFFVGIALVMKIIYSNRKKYRNLTPSIPSWRLSASRSSGNIPAGFALSRDPFAPRTARGEAFGSAHYTAVPPSTTARLSNQQDAFVGNSAAQNDWERQYFEDDTPNDNMNSRLELRR